MNLAELQKQIGIDLTKDAEDLEIVPGSYDFKMFTRDANGNGLSVKAFVEKDEETGEEEYFIAGVASSTIKDLHGDTMLPSALIDMERQANNNLTIFLNHEYKVPEDVAGSVEKAKITSSAQDESGAPIYDLEFEKIRINKTNPRAVDSFKALKGTGRAPKGVKLGLSIGARIPEGGAIRNKKTGALLIAHVDLLETSIVSIPANPRSWIQNAVKALNAGPSTTVKAVVTDDGPELVITPTVTDSGTSVTLGQGLPEPEPTPTPEPQPEPKSAEPEITNAAPSQGAPQSEPGADGAAPEAVVAEATPDPVPAPEGMLRSLVEAQAALGEITTKYIDEVQARIAATAKAARLEQELESLKTFTKDFVADTNQLLARLSRLPAGQKASFKAIAADFDDSLKGVEDIYGADIVATLRSNNT